MQFFIYNPLTAVAAGTEVPPPLINAIITSAGAVEEEEVVAIANGEKFYSLRMNLHTSPPCTAVVMMGKTELESLRDELLTLVPKSILHTV